LLVSQLLHLIEDAPKNREHLIQSLHGYSWSKPIIQAIRAVPLDNLVVRAGNTVLGYSSDLLEMIGYGLSTVFLAAYLLADPHRAKGFLYAIVPRHHHITLAKVLLQLKVIVGGYMRGQLITSLSIGLFVFVLLVAFGVDNALPIALFAALTDIIPFVGGYIASAPVIASVSSRGTTAVIVVAIIMVLYQEFESRILVPRVYGRVLQLPPAVVLVALLVGGTLAGIVGALLALPIAAGVQMLVRELHVELPGEVAAPQDELARDERANNLYEQLTENIPAADAGVIADNLAQIMTKSESAAPSHKPETPTTEMPAVIVEDEPDAPPDDPTKPRRAP
jgi:predicted PurR-regulated permease PerM